MIDATQTQGSAQTASLVEHVRRDVDKVARFRTLAKNAEKEKQENNPGPSDTVHLSPRAKQAIAQAEDGKIVLQLLTQKPYDRNGMSGQEAGGQSVAGSKTDLSTLDSAAIMRLIEESRVNGSPLYGVSDEFFKICFSVSEPPRNAEDAFRTAYAMEEGVKSRQALVDEVYHQWRDARQRAWKHPGLAIFADAIEKRTMTIIPWNEASEELRATVGVVYCEYWDDGENSGQRTGFGGGGTGSLVDAGPQKYTGVSMSTLYGAFFYSYGGPKDE